jgi:hypothetical protein
MEVSSVVVVEFADGWSALGPLQSPFVILKQQQQQQQDQWQ